MESFYPLDNLKGLTNLNIEFAPNGRLLCFTQSVSCNRSFQMIHTYYFNVFKTLDFNVFYTSKFYFLFKYHRKKRNELKYLMDHTAFPLEKFQVRHKRTKLSAKFFFQIQIKFNILMMSTGTEPLKLDDFIVRRIIFKFYAN